MAYLFDPAELHQIARNAVEAHGVSTPATESLARASVLASVEEQLAVRYPKHIERKNPWIFNNAGGAMGQMKLLHASLSEYILIFGTPIGTEGHSGRYGTEVFDFMLDGEMWCYHAGEFQKTIFRPGDLAYLGADKAKGYACPNGVFMLEYSRGVIPSMLPFGLADTLFSTRDHVTMRRTLFQYGKLVVRELLQGKI